MAHRRAGFTLVELMVSIAVIAVLAGIALPAMGAAIANSRMAAAKSGLQSALLRSIARAANAGTPVVLCAARAGACTDSVDWSGGWIAFHDLDGDRARSPADPLVAEEAILQARTTVVSTSGRTRLIFQPSGGNAGSNVTFTFCDSRGPERARSLILSNAGRLREAKADADHAARCAAASGAAR